MDYYNSIEDKSKPILALCVLKGSAQFFHILMNELKNLISKQGNEENSCQIFFEFVRVKSYSNLESTGTVEIQGMDDLSEMKDRHLLIVEDIIDTGRTMKKLLKTISPYQPKSITVATLLIKETDKAIEDRYEPEMCGFVVPDEFVIGCCIDYNQNFRDL